MVLKAIETGEQTPLPKILSHISGAMTRMGHHLHQQKDSWNCVVRLLHYLSQQQQQNQGQNKPTSSVMAVITYLDDMIVIITRT